MYDPRVGRWLSVDPLGFKAGDENLYRYVKNAPTNATDPTGLAQAEVEVSHPFQRSRPILVVVAEIEGDSLSITVKEGPAFQTYSRDRNFPFRAAIRGDSLGGNERFKDTDSVQAAVRWTDRVGREVAHDNNAISQLNLRGDPRSMGAAWFFGGSWRRKNELAIWCSSERPGPTAVRMDTVVVYTDVLDGPDRDLAIVIAIASFTATRRGANAAWSIRANPDDAFKTRRTPADSEIPPLQAETERVLRRQTGYRLRRRTAQDGNTASDTGYDIEDR